MQLKSTIKHAQSISSTESPSQLIEDLRDKLLTLINRRQTARIHVLRRAQDIVKEAAAIASPPGFSMMKLKYDYPSHPDMRISEMTGERVALRQQDILYQCKAQAKKIMKNNKTGYVRVLTILTHNFKTVTQ